MANLTRHEARQAAFQILFALEKDPQNNNIDDLYDIVLEGKDFDDYLPRLINGVLGTKSELDEQITAHLADGWAINRINKADLVILRLAIYELTNQLVPYKVAIDEALILAKTFADEDDRKFVNGMLKNFVLVDGSTTE
ncbi:transcription antitermination factor NusB [Leuconostoc carnosum]|uniref:Transcription antitermination protein NusB n=2 Tax=Leuconostoc carnosum TaxID=1252 RepID=K0D922_LEUCJ|nr:MULTISPECIES: transcription antitermination factor NusB [Leuconostoc]AFT81290.1 transcription antitermination protein NusB [Leuconostoc carnosum JB16]KAA8326622.1 transcription antitermination factor NusB [Leuconostoc carnosum]KAA8330109.1 transcription antitermination factor NusB [Leuconostoc carnosum]KAA8362183.1 transcription antitermination factor NusB [Leuconostoc carnosum]KAA8366732.1 transcription antitermination factor NusB [Leuconostoc carnosum]